MTDPRRGPAVPPGDHLDVDALADVLAGERDGDAHLAACPSCTDRLAELQAAEVAVVASLATLPDPELPDGLSERLTAALRAEPPLRPARRTGTGAARLRSVPAGTGAASSRSVTPAATRRTPWLPSVAAAAVLVLAGGLGWTLLQGQGSPESVDSTAAGGGAGLSRDAGSDARTAAAPARNDSGIDYADEQQRAATLPDVLAGTATAGPPTEALPPDAASADAAGPAAAQTEEDRARQHGPQQVGPAGDDALARLRDPAALDDCLSALRPPDQPELAPLALDHARFRGEPALAVVLPDPDPAVLSLFVVGPGCTATDEQLKLFTRVERP